MTTDRLKAVSFTLKIRTTGMSNTMTGASNAPGVSKPATPVQTLANLAAECARLAAIDGDDTLVLAEVQAALQRVREWRRERKGTT